jgi:hypothetical protein
MDLTHIVQQQRRRKAGPAFDIDFVNYSEGIAQVGPTPGFTRNSSATFVNQNGHIVGKTKSTTSFVPNDVNPNVSVITLDVPSGSVVGWLNGATVYLMQDLDNNDEPWDAQYIIGTILHMSDTRLTLKVTGKTIGTVAISDWWVSYRGPRLEYDPVTLRRRGFLMENGSTNFVQRSSEMHLWGGAGTRVLSTETSPDGISKATLLTAVTNAGGYHAFCRSPNAIASTLNTKYIVSAFVKKGTWRYVSLDWGPLRPSGSLVPFFDLDTLAFNANGSTSTGSALQYSNGWVRLIVTGSASYTGTTPADFFLVGANGGADSSVPAGETAHVWGYQIETGGPTGFGNNATSYIPTTTQSVIRAGDAYGHTSLSSFYNFKGGTIVGQCSLNTPSVELATELVHFGDHDGPNRIQFGVTNGGSQAIRAYIQSSSSGLTFDNGLFGTLSPGPTLRKVAFAFANNDARVCLNGTLGTQDNTISLPQSFGNNNKSHIGGPNKGWDGIITNIQYYRQRLSNSTLQALTTTSTQSLVLDTETITYGSEQLEITI